MRDFLNECANKTKSLRSSLLFHESVDDYEEKNGDDIVINSFLKALSLLELAYLEFQTVSFKLDEREKNV